MNCINCGIELEGRKDAKFCSPKCRVTFSRKQSVVTDNVTFSEPVVTDNFEFTIAQRAGSKPADDAWDESKGKVRTEKYWYEIPLSAVPVYQKDWPELPDFMNGRQYFLWWKNEFAVGDNGEPVILNPLPKHDNLTYYQAGEGSRRWGA